MTIPSPRPAIPSDIALQLCAQIRAENRVQWQSQAARWCWLCEREYHHTTEAMGFSKREGNRGCPLINARYAQDYLTH